YALEKLGESGEAVMVGGRHRDYYTAMAAELDAPAGAGHTDRLVQAEREIDNLRSAFAWSFENGDIDPALRLAASLQPLWLTRWRIREGLGWLDAALAAEAGADTSNDPARVRALADKGQLHSWLGTAEGAPIVDEALLVARELGDPALVIRALVVRLRFDLAEGVASALDFGDDVVGGGLPDEGLGVAVPMLGPGGDRRGEIGDTAEGSTAQAFVGEFLEPAFDEVQPGTRGRREMQVPAATVLVRQPFRDLWRGVRGEVVQDDMHIQIARNRGIDLFEKPQHVGTGMALAQIGQDLAGGDVERREQIDRAVALVIMGHRPRPARLHRQRRLGAVQRLTLGLLVEAEHRRPGRRIQVQAHHIDQLLLEPRVVADFERLDPPWFETVVGPDLGHRVLADPHAPSQRAGAPMRGPVRRALVVGQAQHLFDCARRQARLASAALGDPAHCHDSLLGEPETPAAHRIRVHATTPRDLLIGHAVARQQQSSSLHHLPMRRRRRGRQPLQLRTLLI